MFVNHRKLLLLLLLPALAVAGPFVNAGFVPESWDIVYDVLVGWVGLLAIVLCVRRTRPRGAVWPLLTASVALGAAATMMPTLVGEGRGSETPRLGDAILLLSGLLLAAAMLRILVARESRRFVALDMLTIVVSVGLVAGLLLIGPAFASSTLALSARLILVAHAVIGIVVISAVIHLLMGPRPLPPALRLVAAAGGAFVMSELLWNWGTLSGSYIPGLWADTGWNLQPLLLGLAALHPSMRQLGERGGVEDGDSRHSTAVMLGLAGLVGPLLIGAPDLDEHAGYVLATWLGGGTISVLVITRFSLLLRRSRSLANTLDADLAERGRLLLESEDRYRQLVEQIPAVIYDAHVDEDGALYWQYVSPQCAAILGIDADALYEDSETWWAGVHDEDRAGAKAEVLHHGVAGHPSTTEFRFVRPDGQEIWLRNTAITISDDEAGRDMQGFMFDVTSVKQGEADREQMEAELRLAQKLESVGQLAAGIAHEINTPIQFVGDSVAFLGTSFDELMTLVGVYGELKRSAEQGTPAPELVQRISDAEVDADLEYLTERVPAAFARTIDGVQRVGTIVRAMREFAHPPSVELTPVDLNDIVENALIVATSEYKYIADVTRDLGELPAVVCNRGDINQVLLNLIVNAAHAIADAVGDSNERGMITIRTVQEDETVRISVADSGTGIPPAIAERIYDQFFTTKAVGRGTGQGLAITRGIIERHDGTISFDSTEGEGTTFHIILPTHGRVAEQELETTTA
jgi:PAS domain S-box-containing protein